MEFAGSLDPVEPEIVMIELIQDEETKKDFKEIEFNKSLFYPFEFTIWSSAFLKLSSIEDIIDVMKIFFVLPFPLYLDFSWKFDRNQ